MSLCNAMPKLKPSHFYRLLGGVACLLALVGCAQSPYAGSTAGGVDLRTTEQKPEQQRAQIRYELATGYFEQGKDRVALDEVNQVLQLVPNFLDAWILRGLIYMRLNEDAPAIESLKRAQSLSGNNAIVANNLGILYCRAKRYNEGYAQLNKAIASGGTDLTRPYMYLGVCQMQAGDKKAAEQSLRQSLNADPNNPISGYNLAVLLYEQQQFEQARFYVRKINNSEQANAQTLWLGIRIERALGNAFVVHQLSTQLRSRYPHSHEVDLLEREAFND